METTNGRQYLSDGSVITRRPTPRLHCIWWRLRTQLEKTLICGWTAVSLLFLGLIIAIIILLSIQCYSKSNVCQTKECLNSASQILAHLDESVSPCHDFYRFSCGRWLDSTPIPDDSDSVSTFSQLQDNIDLKLKELLSQPLSASDSRTVKNMKKVYNSCMNLSLANGLETEPLMKYIQQLGGWPVLEGSHWNESNFNFSDLMTKLRRFGFKTDLFFKLRVAPNMKRNKEFKIYILEPTLSPLTKQELINNRTYKMKLYLDLMVDISVVLGVDEQRAEQEFKEVIRLESLIAKTIINSGNYQSVTIGDVYTTFSNEWIQLLNGLLSTNYTVNEDDTIIVFNIQTLKDLNQIIVDYTQKHKRVVANFVIWKIVYQSIKVLGNNLIDLENEFYSQMRSLKRNTKHWKNCLNILTTNMKTGITSLYLTNDSSKEDKRKMATQMYDNMRSILINKFDAFDWMDDETRFNSIIKINFINHFIGYKNELLNENIIDNIYESLGDLESDNLFENLLRLQRNDVNNEYNRLNTINNRSDWQNIVTNTVVNAYYSPYINSIKIPIWILEGIFFGTKRPNYLNYGALGWIIGHELIHPFDNIGGKFDKRGNLRDWWDVEVKETFYQKAQCYIGQYKNYSINGRSTLSEDIADNGGIDTAFKSYKEFVRHRGNELLLPGLNYTQEQLFWISAANVWCHKLTPQYQRLFIRNSIHSLSEYRVLASFGNSKEFSKVFKCKENDRMNPKERCKLW